MKDLTKSDVEDLMFQQPGVLVNTNNEDFENYIKRRKIHQVKDAEIANLNSQINILNEKLEAILAMVSKNTQ